MGDITKTLLNKLNEAAMSDDDIYDAVYAVFQKAEAAFKAELKKGLKGVKADKKQLKTIYNASVNNWLESRMDFDDSLEGVLR